MGGSRTADSIAQARARQVLPTFLTLNTDDTSYGAGYFSAELGPFNIPSLSGMGMDSGDPPDDPDRFRRRYDLLGNLQAATTLTGRDDQVVPRTNPNP